MKPQFAENQDFVRYEALLLRLNSLMAVGTDETEEGEKIREALETLYWRLTQAEREWIGGLSADLYMLQEDEVFEPLDTEQTQETLQQDLTNAWKHQDVISVLRLLRKGPQHLPREVVASLRAYAYEKLGLLESAAQFRLLAARLSEKPADHHISVLPLLYRLGYLSQVEELAQNISRNRILEPIMRLISVYYLYRVFSYHESELSENIRRYVVPILQELVAELPEEWLVLAYQFLGDSLTLIGEAKGARAAYEFVLRIEPANPAARRGVYMLNADSDRARTAVDIPSNIGKQMESARPFRVAA